MALLLASILLLVGGAARAEFTLDGIVFESTPVIRTHADILAATYGWVNSQSITNATAHDIYFRTATGQFVLGLYDNSTPEVVFFNAPSQGAGFTVNATGAGIGQNSSASLSEGAAGTVIRAITANGDFMVEPPFSLVNTLEFTAKAATVLSRVTRGKFHSSGLFFAVTGDASIPGGGPGGDALVAFRLTGTSPDFSGAVTGTVQALPDCGHSGKPPGVAITPNNHLMVSNMRPNGTSGTNVNFRIYSYSGRGTGSETGSFTWLESGNMNTLAGLTGGDQIGSASSIAFGVNGKGLVVLAVVDNNETIGATDGADDRIIFFVERAPQGTVIEIE